MSDSELSTAVLILSNIIVTDSSSQCSLLISHDEITREKALATVVQGQNAENLLDFGEDDEVASNGASGTPSGIGMMDDMMGGSSSSSNSAQQQSGGSQLNDLLGL